MAIREELIERIEKHIAEDYAELSAIMQKHGKRTGDNGHYAWLIQEVLAGATLNQLWALYKLSQQGTRYEILGCNPRDPYIAISFGGMYVGIEPDGHTHS